VISDIEARQYLAKVGSKSGAKILSVIETLAPFIEASTTDIGKELLRDDIEQHCILLNRIYKALIETGSANQSDVIKLQILDGRLKAICARLKAYSDGITAVKGRPIEAVE
jgi:hypothetical protein